jgi:serine/threonine protein kinase
MMTGLYPFSGKTKDQIYKAIAEREPNYKKIQGAGEQVIDVIKACLQKRAEDRPTIA